VKSGIEHNTTITQLSKNARNLLVANMACFVFVLGLYGKKARIYRCTRRAIIVSKAFNYITNPNILAEFFGG